MLAVIYMQATTLKISSNYISVSWHHIGLEMKGKTEVKQWTLSEKRSKDKEEP